MSHVKNKPLQRLNDQISLTDAAHAEPGGAAASVGAPLGRALGRGVARAVLVAAVARVVGKTSIATIFTFTSDIER